MFRGGMLTLFLATACSPKPTTSPADPPAPTTDGEDAPPPGDPPNDPGTAPPPDTSAPCEKSECGPAMGMPNTMCPDGKTTAGPACLRDVKGICGYQVIECPK